MTTTGVLNYLAAQGELLSKRASGNLSDAEDDSLTDDVEALWHKLSTEEQHLVRAHASVFGQPHHSRLMTAILAVSGYQPAATGSTSSFSPVIVEKRTQVRSAPFFLEARAS